MGGDMTVESKVGWGSVFRFHIRLQEIGANAVEVRHKTRRIIALEPEQPQYRILIVDDRQVNRQLLSKLLLSVSSPMCGFEIREAANGKEAFDIWKAWDPHLIWMDIRMPVMNGYETTKQIKATKKGQSTVIIALTAISLEDEETTALSVGCDDFLRKPMHEADIFHLLHKYLGVRFVYENGDNQQAQENRQEPETIVTPDMLAELPFGLYKKLRQAAEVIDLDTTNAILDQLRPHNPRVTDALTELVNSYRFDLLQKLLISREDEDMG
jgi:CheY-like chemotaxis protein